MVKIGDMLDSFAINYPLSQISTQLGSCEFLQNIS